VKLSGKSRDSVTVQFRYRNYSETLGLQFRRKWAVGSPAGGSNPFSLLRSKHLVRKSKEQEYRRGCAPPCTWPTLAQAESAETLAQNFSDVFFLVAVSQSPGE